MSYRGGGAGGGRGRGGGGGGGGRGYGGRGGDGGGGRGYGGRGDAGGGRGYGGRGGDGGGGREYGGRGGDGGGGRGYGGRGGDGGGGGRGYGGRGGGGGGRGPYQAPSVGILSKQTWQEAAVISDVQKKLTLSGPPASSKAIRPPARPGFGEIGVKCVVRANHFLVNLADRDYHHYDVSISPEVASKTKCRLIVAKLVQLYKDSNLGKRSPQYDGKKGLYTAGPLPFTSKDFVVKLPKERDDREEDEYRVSIRATTVVNSHTLQEFLSGRLHEFPQDVVQSLDVVLRGAKPLNEYVVIGRSFFSTSLGKDELGEGLEYWRGYYQSLRPTQMGLSLNIDGSAQPFYEPILVCDYVAKFLNLRDLLRPLSDSDRNKVKRALRGIRVETRHTGYKKSYKITGISNEPANKLMFTLDSDATQTSVAQYFMEKYRVTLRFPSLPCIQVGQPSKPTFLPMEVCKIADGQKYGKKLNERQVTALLRATCQRPHEREGSILKMMKDNRFGQNPVLKNEFGIQITEMFTSVDARVLPPPMLEYHSSGREPRVAPGVGAWNMIDKKMYNGGTVDRWTCLNFSRMQQDLVQQFCMDLASMCSSKGMTFNPRPAVAIRSFSLAQIEKALFDVYSQARNNLQLLIIILPDVSGSYGKIKRICETELGIVSQCCQPKQAAKLSKQYLENVALKINVKAGGRNTVLADAVGRNIPILTDKVTIVFGADVTHATPGEDSSPSIAAVVASMDWPEVTKYRGLVSAQGHREEIIQDLYKEVLDPKRGKVGSGMIRELLVAFRRSTGHKPDRIIFYRDGVSEGQFAEVLAKEMDAIRRACVSLQEDYLPRVTFVVVQKRHHTRLFPVNRSMADRSGNIMPGTVIDTKICHPTEFDFYLCSHAGIQGTSRPTHYHVLYDENNFTADLLQLLTNSLCYTYARCTRSVSIVPPAYYAHLAAFRARYYVEGDANESGSSSGGGGPVTAERQREVRALPQIKENVKDVMFYC